MKYIQLLTYNVILSLQLALCQVVSHSDFIAYNFFLRLSVLYSKLHFNTQTIPTYIVIYW